MRRFIGVLALVGLGAGGLAAGMFAGSGAAGPTAAEATSRITVSATDFKFRLSKQRVPTGTVIFTVINRGRIAHDFKIAGKKTKQLAPGKRQTLRVKIGRRGRFSYICTLPGHAAAGMKGTLTVGPRATGTTTQTTTTTVTTPTTTTTTTTTTPTVTGPSTSVNVDMFEYRFDLSQATIPSGTVTFVITNRGQEPHNFDIGNVKAGAILGPGQSETWTVSLPPRTYSLVCDVPFHIDRGMVGQLVVN
jgi:uncharacterized cupredoxin-like copper-binding protein